MEYNYNINKEVIRDFCGTLKSHNMGHHTVTAKYLEVLPEAVDFLVSYYHFDIAETVSESKTIIYDKLVSELNGIIPVDSDYWCNLDVIRRIYKTVYNIKFMNLGERLIFVCDSIINSDYNKASEFIYDIDDEEVSIILSKAINGHEPCKISMDSFRPYYERFGR